jgi:hypothetical protein
MPAYNDVVNVYSSCHHSRSSQGQRKEREQHIATDMLTTGQTRAASGCLDT